VTGAADVAGLAWLTPEAAWPSTVRALTTLRHGGASTGSHAGLNLAAHVDDQPAHVQENRRRLRLAAALPAEPAWLEQVHGVAVFAHDGPPPTAPPRADAAVTSRPGQVCAVLTADCLPVVFASRDGTRVGVAHAGWRGLADGVLEATVAALGVPPAEVVAWLGPAIGPQAFEVGEDVRTAFIARAADNASAFAPNEAGRHHADLYRLARLALARVGVHEVTGGGLCTVTDAERFYSFRRDGGRTGRMATLAWIQPGNRRAP
jgi:YfiH family protein